MPSATAERPRSSCSASFGLGLAPDRRRALLAELSALVGTEAGATDEMTPAPPPRPRGDLRDARPVAARPRSDAALPPAERRGICELTPARTTARGQAVRARARALRVLLQGLVAGERLDVGADGRRVAARRRAARPVGDPARARDGRGTRRDWPTGSSPWRTRATRWRGDIRARASTRWRAGALVNEPPNRLERGTRGRAPPSAAPRRSGRASGDRGSGARRRRGDGGARCRGSRLGEDGFRTRRRRPSRVEQALDRLPLPGRSRFRTELGSNLLTRNVATVAAVSAAALAGPHGGVPKACASSPARSEGCSCRSTVSRGGSRRSGRRGASPRCSPWCSRPPSSSGASSRTSTRARRPAGHDGRRDARPAARAGCTPSRSASSSPRSPRRAARRLGGESSSPRASASSTSASSSRRSRTTPRTPPAVSGGPSQSSSPERRSSRRESSRASSRGRSTSSAGSGGAPRAARRRGRRRGLPRRGSRVPARALTYSVSNSS